MSTNTSQFKNSPCPTTGGPIGAAGSRGGDTREAINNAPTIGIGREFRQSTNGKRIVGVSWLINRKGDETFSREVDLLTKRHQQMDGCGRPGGEVFAATRIINGEKFNSVLGLLRCNLWNVCTTCSNLKAGDRFRTTYQAVMNYLEQDQENNGLAHIVLTVPRAKTIGYGKEARRTWAESTRLAKAVWREFAAHGLRTLRKKFQINFTLRVSERQYSNWGVQKGPHAITKFWSLE